MLVRDDHGAAVSLRLLLLEPQRKIFQDRAEMNFRQAQRHGDVFQLLALLGGDAVVGESVR